MKAKWNLFYGQRTNEGKFVATVRNGAFVATGSFCEDLDSAVRSAEESFEKQFHSLVTDSSDLSALLD